MDWIRQDAVTAIRGFVRSPGFALAAILTLALGIGANTAIFSVVYAVLLRPLPFSEPDRLVTIQTVLGSAQERYTLRMADYLDMQARSKSFEQSALIRRGESVNLTGTGDPERIRAASVTPSLFPMLRVQPLMGRTFREDESQPGRDRVVLVSYGFWQNRLAGRRDVLSVQLQVNGDTCDVIGVLADGFDMPDTDTELWRPLVVAPAEIQARMMLKYLGFARLSPGISLDAAQADLQSISAALADEYPRTNKQARFELSKLQEARSGAARTPLIALLATVLLVVLIGCANVANLLLVRATGRHQELAVRAAMGASRARLQRLMWMEVLLLTGTGALAGIATAAVALRWILALAPGDTPGLREASINPWVLMFSIGLSLVTSMLVGAAPASMASHADGIDALRQRAGAGGSLWARRARATLVTVEIALCVMLLTGTGLLLRSFEALLRVDPGLRPEGVFTLRVSLPVNRYRDQASWRTFQTRVLDRAASMPTIASIAIINRMPFDGGLQTAPLTVQGRSREEQVLDQADMRFVSADYFQTVGIRLLRGRRFTAADNEDAPLTIILDDVLSRRYFGSEDPVGRTMKLGAIDSSEPWRTVVGVVNTVLGDGLDRMNRGQAYLPYQHVTSDRFAILATATGGSQTIDTSLREAVRFVDPNQAVFSAQTLSSVMESTLGPRRFPLLLLSFFAVTALLLAASGMYSVISYSVNQRTQEIGIRMALGAGVGSVLRMVLAEAGRLALAGTLIGLAGSALLSSTIRSLLFQVGAFDVAAFAGACCVVLAATAIAGVLPARRAARLDPYAAIRND